ncbi:MULTISPECIES: hypothetical protein [Pseudomonas]|uniref:hypothetical protein n=1 Tax=Pseudomonas TaxID=286 RepID=UPI000474EEEB|nr:MULTISPECIES: hypothetical protein [Pseudomonas]TKJ57566.1 hypothetical protein PspCFBP13506_23625 [Pseudomonas sp. CFBP13506]
MNIERTQHIGHYGVTFTVIRLTVLPANRQALANLCLLEAGPSANEVRYGLMCLYEKMLARDLPCKMTIAIAKPLSRQQADLLNERATIIALLLAAAFSAPIRPFSKPIARVVATSVGVMTKNIMRSYHAGDVVIGIEAQVEGGIGPQRSISAMVMPLVGG